MNTIIWYNIMVYYTFPIVHLVERMLMSVKFFVMLDNTALLYDTY